MDLCSSINVNIYLAEVQELLSSLVGVLQISRVRHHIVREFLVIPDLLFQVVTVRCDVPDNRVQLLLGHPQPIAELTEVLLDLCKVLQSEGQLVGAVSGVLVETVIAGTELIRVLLQDTSVVFSELGALGLQESVGILDNLLDRLRVVLDISIETLWAGYRNNMSVM